MRPCCRHKKLLGIEGGEGRHARTPIFPTLTSVAVPPSFVIAVTIGSVSLRNNLDLMLCRLGGSFLRKRERNRANKAERANRARNNARRRGFGAIYTLVGGLCSSG